MGASLFVAVEARAPDPMIDLSLFGKRGFVGGTLILGLWSFGVFGVTVLGAILAARQTTLIHQGYQPQPAFVAGYQLALIVAAIIVAAGVPVSLYALRRGRTQPDISPVPHSRPASAPEATVLAA